MIHIKHGATEGHIIIIWYSDVFRGPNLKLPFLQIFFNVA